MPMQRKFMAILVLILCVGMGISVYDYDRGDEILPAGDGERAQAVTDNKDIYVYVSGAVNRPCVVRVSEGARAIDAVDMAGGLLPTADEASVNMAKILTDGEQVHIAERSAAEDKIGGKDDGKVNINTADEKTLDTLEGIGPVMAKRIIEHRKASGRFKRIEDLKDVNGIGEAKFEKVKDKITI